METRNLRKERVGVVKSNKMNKSVTVSIERKEKHTMYGKFMKKLLRLLLMTSQMIVISVIPFVSWKHVH